jgi:hypothetical protein
MRAFCKRCKHTQDFVRIRPNHKFHVALAILTGGLWLISYISICIGARFRPWRCKHCGWHHPSKHDIEPDAELKGEAPISTVITPQRNRRRYDEPDTPHSPVPLGT